MSTGDELRAAVSARRELGPDYEDAVVESFLDRMGKEVDRRVDERLATANPKALDKRQKTADGLRLALAIVSMSLGTLGTIAIAVSGGSERPFLIIWLGIVLVNLVFALGRRSG
ncbi:hypothetical protein ACIBHX_03680 [Nonomuraea sp. NPDC050536]|uniref:hypothetical protein n=1 Tax=Nonomuraea sp. NPDC050536 TaxID=3364366 RepID=UPI0037CBF4A5